MVGYNSDRLLNYLNKGWINNMYDCTDDKFKLEYARAYILPQKYENLYSICKGFWKGTIFKDLYRPYKEKKEC